MIGPVTALASSAGQAVAGGVVATSGWRHDGGWFPWFPLLPLLVVGSWIVLLALVLRRRPPTGGPSAEAVLAERYARGEIDERELLERRAVLRRRR